MLYLFFSAIFFKSFRLFVFFFFCFCFALEIESPRMGQTVAGEMYTKENCSLFFTFQWKNPYWSRLFIWRCCAGIKNRKYYYTALLKFHFTLKYTHTHTHNLESTAKAITSLRWKGESKTKQEKKVAVKKPLGKWQWIHEFMNSPFGNDKHITLLFSSPIIADAECVCVCVCVCVKLRWNIYAKHFQRATKRNCNNARKKTKENITN